MPGYASQRDIHRIPEPYPILTKQKKEKRKPEMTSLSWMARMFSSEERQVGGGKRRLTSLSTSYVLKNRPGDFAKCISIFTAVEPCSMRS